MTATYTRTATSIRIVCSDTATLEAIKAAMREAGWSMPWTDGLVVEGKGKAKQIAKAESCVIAAGATAHAISAPSYRYREIVLARTAAPQRQTITVDGATLNFTGFGKEFVGREVDGHLWGEPVRYAYYA